MSDAHATQRFQEAVQAFRGLEEKLRGKISSVAPKKIDAVLIDLAAAIPGLTGEDLGRAMVFKAYVFHWRYLTELSKKVLFNVDAPVDPRLTEALEEARKGRELLRAPGDLKWAEATVEQLEEYQR